MSLRFMLLQTSVTWVLKLVLVNTMALGQAEHHAQNKRQVGEGVHKVIFGSRDKTDD